MIFKLLVEEIVKNYNAYENIDKTPVNIVEKSKVNILNKATEFYTKNSKIINNKLWDDKSHGDLSESALIRIKNIHSCLDTSSPPKQDILLYSGVRRDPQELAKSSGGILHHAAFLSTSVDPNVALRFTKKVKDTNGNDVHHVIKIKVRKGQQVGGYLGDDSEHKSEKEFLVKSNQLLHIHPNPTDYIDKEGRTIRVHDAIILNKRECDKESEHPESQSKIDFEERLNEI